jgi:hypothetical protein
MPATRGRPPALLAYLDGLESAGLPVPTFTRLTPATEDLA